MEPARIGLPGAVRDFHPEAAVGRIEAEEYGRGALGLKAASQRADIGDGAIDLRSWGSDEPRGRRFRHLAVNR
jgi:hypothetical protein